ncbi:MAG: cytochrome c [Gemmobacter sp.]
MKPFSMTAIPALAIGIAVATAVAANPVDLRQETMKTVRQNFAVLGGMATGQAAYDAAAAMQAQAALAEITPGVPALFEAEAPGGDARPEIWSNWEDFTTKAEALASATAALDASSLDSLRAGMGAVGGACQACHTNYRSD